MSNLAQLMRNLGVMDDGPNEPVATLPEVCSDPLPRTLPDVFRVESVERYPAGPHQMVTRVRLFHEKASLTVDWQSQHADVRIARGVLVSIRWPNHPASHNGAIRISRLVVLERATADVNLFDLVPHTWVPDRNLVKRAAGLLESLPRGFLHLFNAVFWDGSRFERYLVGPSSLNGHHNYRNGNFRHSVEVAEMALQQGCSRVGVYSPLLTLGALLHDAGKADEYRYDHARRRFTLSDRGELIGHRQTLLEWVATAREHYRVILPETHYLALVHTMTAVRGAPDWLGLRIPRRLEAIILAKVDAISGDADLFGQTLPQDGGDSTYHKHLGARPFRL